MRVAIKTRPYKNHPLGDMAFGAFWGLKAEKSLSNSSPGRFSKKQLRFIIA
jgi:hypothetical protein